MNQRKRGKKMHAAYCPRCAFRMKRRLIQMPTAAAQRRVTNPRPPVTIKSHNSYKSPQTWARRITRIFYRKLSILSFRFLKENCRRNELNSAFPTFVVFCQVLVQQRFPAVGHACFALNEGQLLRCEKFT
jgi:hypothetical protein